MRMILKHFTHWRRRREGMLCRGESRQGERRMSRIRILAGAFALAFAALAHAASVDEVRRLLIQERFEQADAMAQEMFAAAKGADKTALQQRLVALNLLIDSAEVQHKLAGEQAGAWIESALAIGRQLYGEESRSNVKLLAAQASREHQLAAADKALGAHSAELLARALDWEAHRKGELANADVAFVYRTAYSLAFGADTPRAVAALAHADQVLSHPQTDWERRWHAYQLGALGDLQLTGEHPAPALARAREGVALAARESGRDSIFYGGLRFSLAQALFFTSDYQGARESIEPAVDVFRKHPAAAPIYLDASLSLLGDSLLELGDYGSARQCFTEMIARLKAREPMDASSAEMYVTALNNFGSLEQAQGHTEPARAWFRQEIDAIENLKAPAEDRMLIVPLASLGDLEVRAGNAGLADGDFRRAAEWVSKENEVFFAAWVLLGQARVSLARGDAKKAEDLLSNAIARSMAAGGEQQVVTASLHCDRALALARLGRADLAFEEASAR